MKMLLQLVLALTASFVTMHFIGAQVYWTIAALAGVCIALLVWAVHVRKEGAPLLVELFTSAIVAALAGVFWPGVPIALSFGSAVRRKADRTETPNTDDEKAA